MTLFVGLLAVALVVGQLDTVQHAALMTVYDALGALVDKRKKTFFAFFSPLSSRLRQRDVPSLHDESTVHWWSIVVRWEQRHRAVRHRIAFCRVG